jgi:hypothetical protein
MTNATRNIAYCIYCKHEWLPYGNHPIIPPVCDELVCPNCGKTNRIIWDKELDRENARKRLGLDTNPTLSKMQSDYNELNRRLEVSEGRIKDLEKGIIEIRELVDAAPKKIRKEVEEAIAEAQKNMPGAPKTIDVR